MLIPNIGRVLVKRLNYTDKMSSSGILIPGQLKAGENLFVGEVVHPGTDALGNKTRFKKGQIVYYSEYSAAAAIDMAPLIKGEKTMGDIIGDVLYVVAEDDVMAYEEDLNLKVPEEAKTATPPGEKPELPVSPLIS